MAITVEDGTIVSGANSYVSLDDARTYASVRGVTLSAVDAELEPLLIQAMDFLEDLRDRYKGWKRTKSQPLQWPREDVYIDGWHIENTTIPMELKNAQMAAVVELHNGEELMPNAPTNGPTRREKVDVIEVEYDNKNRVSGVSAFAKPYAQLAPLLRRNGMTVVRA